MEKEIKSGIELTLRHLASTLGLVPLVPSSEDAAASPTAGTMKTRSVSLRGTPSSSTSAYDSLQDSVHRLVRDVDAHDKYIQDLKVDTKVEIRDLQRNVEDLRQEQRSSREVEALTRKMERLGYPWLLYWMGILIT